jgi:hypothetical protein
VKLLPSSVIIFGEVVFGQQWAFVGIDWAFRIVFIFSSTFTTDLPFLEQRPDLECVSLCGRNDGRAAMP